VSDGAQVEFIASSRDTKESPIGSFSRPSPDEWMHTKMFYLLLNQTLSSLLNLATSASCVYLRAGWLIEIGNDFDWKRRVAPFIRRLSASTLSLADSHDVTSMHSWAVADASSFLSAPLLRRLVDKDAPRKRFNQFRPRVCRPA